MPAGAALGLGAPAGDEPSEPEPAAGEDPCEPELAAGVEPLEPAAGELPPEPATGDEPPLAGATGAGVACAGTYGPCVIGNVIASMGHSQ